MVLRVCCRLLWFALRCSVRQNTQTLCRSIFGFDTVEECIRSARAKQSKAQDICADRIEFSVAKALDACLQVSGFFL